KASGLARLESAGFSVPAAICVTTEFYRRWLTASGVSRRLDELIRASASRRQRLAVIRDQVETASIPDDLAGALAEGTADLTADWDGALCVRSSAGHEDGAAASPAGIHASVVVAKPDLSSVIAAVKRCWASLWTESAWSYRDRLGVPHAEAVM